jgi:hypothetical protein
MKPAHQLGSPGCCFGIGCVTHSFVSSFSPLPSARCQIWSVVHLYYIVVGGLRQSSLGVPFPNLFAVETPPRIDAPPYLLGLVLLRNPTLLILAIVLLTRLVIPALFLFILCFRTSAWARVRVYDLSIKYVFVTLVSSFSFALGVWLPFHGARVLSGERTCAHADNPPYDPSRDEDFFAPQVVSAAVVPCIVNKFCFSISLSFLVRGTNYSTFERYECAATMLID